MKRAAPAVITGRVRRVVDLGGVVLVDLDLAPHLLALLVIDYKAGRIAARRWQPGDKITAWGWTADPGPQGPPTAGRLDVRAHTIQRWRAGHPANPLDPIRRIPPRHRPDKPRNYRPNSPRGETDT